MLPLDRSVAVKLTHADWSWKEEEATPEVVNELNIRTYAWASEEIYGSTQPVVVGVRELARRNAPLAARFRPRQSGLVIDNNYPVVGGGHRREMIVTTPRASSRRPGS